MATARFRPRHVSRNGVITVELPFDEALELFTPEGERQWVDDWDPEYLYRAGGGDEIDTVFRTTHGGEETLWIVLEHDRENGTVSYSRITPGSRLGTVAVSVDRIDERTCWVDVSYELTGISEAGNKVLEEQFTPRAYREMLDEWQRRIAALALR